MLVECKMEFFNESVMCQFGGENMWNLIYEDDGEQDLYDEEVVYADNLFKTRSAERQ